MMTRYEMDKLVSRIADEVVRRLDERNGKKLISAGEAAKRLGISRNRLYRIKDNFPHTQRNGRLFFVESELPKTYINK